MKHGPMENTHARQSKIQTERKTFPWGPEVEVYIQGHFDSKINTTSESYDDKASNNMKEGINTYIVTSL